MDDRVDCVGRQGH